MTATLTLEAATNATWSYGPIPLLIANAPIALPDGTAIRMQLKGEASSVDVALELSDANGRIVVSNASAAEIAIEVPASVMQNVKAGTYVFDILVKQPSERVHRPVEGTVQIKQGVTGV